MAYTERDKWRWISLLPPVMGATLFSGLRSYFLDLYLGQDAWPNQKYSVYNSSE